MYFLLGNIPYYFPLIGIGIQMIIIKLNANESDKILNLVYKYKNDIEAYSKMLNLIEKKRFNSEYLVKLKKILLEKIN